MRLSGDRGTFSVNSFMQQSHDGAWGRFGARFGEPLSFRDFTRSRRAYLETARRVTIISDVTEDGKPIGKHGDGERHLHTDLGFTDTPSALTILPAREMPPAEVDTNFANMCAALEALPHETRDRIRKLRMKHQASHNTQGGKRPGYKSIETDDVRGMPRPIQPIVRTNPLSGRQALYRGRRFGAYVTGLPLTKSGALCDELLVAANAPDRVSSRSWQVGDLGIWDHRAILRRREALTDHGWRRMHRLTTRGERPA